ncbi:hypothetical protein M422DRAFT_30271 [Sphaerobolus stellatus SS14]|uniref:Uncharacterized protein n=1 Tax=Sphaerobolus stellatus (strain SS14) TaxID=990650 RepID=A0A0C9W093_SPHS4|nr:hypothetical protein M422DRAFT_30271 [Sphaerobolus stellatus SS14]
MHVFFSLFYDHQFARRGGRHPSSIEASLGSAAYTVQRTGIDSEHTEDIAEILGSSGTFRMEEYG